MKIHQLIVVLITFSWACTQTKTPEIDIPQNLQNQPEAVALVKNLDKTAQKINAVLYETTGISGKKDGNNFEELNSSNVFKMGKMALKMQKYTSQFEAYKATRSEIESKLTPSQQKTLDSLCQHIEKNVMLISLTNASEDSTEIRAQENAKAKLQAESDSINALRQEAIAAMPPEQRKLYETENQAPKNTPTFFKVLFVLAFVGIFVFGILKKIKRLKNTISDMDFAVNDAKNILSDIKNEMESNPSKKERLTEAEKKGFESLNKFLNH